MSDVDDTGFLFFILFIAVLLYLSFNDFPLNTTSEYLEDASLAAHMEWAFGYY